MGPESDEVIYETTGCGSLLRCAALHVPTLTEVVVQGPARAGAGPLQALALRKLVHVLNRRHGGQHRSGLSVG